jgi:hypothetical protein
MNSSLTELRLQFVAKQLDTSTMILFEVRYGHGAVKDVNAL